MAARVPAGGGQGVRDDEAIGVDHPGQGGGETGQHETVDSGDAEGRGVEEPVGHRGENQQGRGAGQGGPQEVPVEEDLPSGPAVQQNPGEGPDQGVGQEEHRHRGSDGGGRRLLLGGEDDVRGEGDLVDAVGGLGQQPHGQQAAEVPQAQQGAQITRDRHGSKRHTRRGSAGGLPGTPDVRQE